MIQDGEPPGLRVRIECDRVTGRLSQDLKKRIVRRVMDEGCTQAETARRLMISEATVSRTMKAGPLPQSSSHLVHRRCCKQSIWSGCESKLRRLRS